MRRLWIAVALLMFTAVGLAGKAEAQYLDGNKLLRLCESDSQTDQAMCVGYIMGLDDVTTTYDLWDEMTKRFCVPEDTPNSQLRQVVIDGLRVTYFIDEPAAGTTAIILQRAFPCD